MINYKEITQGTEDWFNIKWGKIGGTLAKGLHIKSDTLFIDILSQHLEEFEYEEESFKSSAMERGNELEPHARKYLSEYSGIDFKETGWLQSEENELLGISPDGITEDETIQCEIKCFGRKKHTEVLLSQEVPSEYIPQCIHAFTVNQKLKQLYFIAFRPESVKNSFIKIINLKTLVDIGLTKEIEIEVIGKKGTPIKPKKKKVPDLVTIREAVELSILKANILLSKVKEAKENLMF